MGCCNILDSLNPQIDDFVQLDGICYRIANSLPGCGLNATNQAVYSTCDDCLSNTTEDFYCEHTFVACFEDEYNAGDVLAAPTRKNTGLPTNDVIGSTYEYLQFSEIMTNGDSNTFEFVDCYVYDNTYNETIDYETYHDISSSCCDSNKCAGGHVAVRTCDTYVGTEQPSLNNNQLELLSYMGCDFLSGSSQSGGIISSSDTLYIPEMLGSSASTANVTTLTDIIWEDGFSGTCFTIIGKTSNINMTQDNVMGTALYDNASGTTDCNNTQCHCVSGVTITNNSITDEFARYLQCGSMGVSELISITVPAAGVFVINDCINFNSLVLSRTINESVGDITYTIPNNAGCSEYVYFDGSQLTICCDSTDNPITTDIGLPISLGVTPNDYVIVDGDAYQLGGYSSTDTGTIYTDATGPYTDCNDALSATPSPNPCRYDMIPCCDTNGASNYPPFTWEVLELQTINDTFRSTAPPPYAGQTDKCVSVQTYTGNYNVDNYFPTVMEYNGSDCINRCSRCSYAVQPCGYPPNWYIIVTLTPQSGMITGSIWYDSGLSNWLTSNGLPSANCYEILAVPTPGNFIYKGAYSSGYNYTQTSVTGCSDSSC